MSQLTFTVMRLYRRLEQSRFGGDTLAMFAGFVFFSVTVGIEKLNPRNVAWLTFGDQQQHLLGWWFYASDQWRWPLGANPKWGWEGTNSIVYTDSWPGMALIFKALNIEAVNHGQYFGLGFLFGAIALFIGARRIFRSLGIALLPSLAASGLLGTTSVFWWMHRWYPALSAGLPILVWALFFYVDDPTRRAPLWRRWSLLLVVAAATHAYLTIVVVAILGALLIRRLIRDYRSWSRLVTSLVAIGTITGWSMYLLGYFTLPSKWAQTGGYGWYSANTLGLIDSKDASRFLPTLPSVSGQHEPTALGLGTLLLLTALIVHRLKSRASFGVLKSTKEHSPLIVVLLGLSILAVTNTVSIGSWSYRIPLPTRLEHGLSIFRSSARMLWPTLIVITVVAVVYSLRRLHYGALFVSVALVLQIFDSTPQIQTVASAEDGNSVSIVYDEAFWSAVPKKYTTIASLPAESLGRDWASCALAAVNSGRRAECGYFSRVQGLEGMSRLRKTQILTGALDPKVIYMISSSWLETEYDLLRTLRDRDLDAVATAGIGGFSADTIFLFPKCDDERSCNFLDARYRLLE